MAGSLTGDPQRVAGPRRARPSSALHSGLRWERTRRRPGNLAARSRGRTALLGVTELVPRPGRCAAGQGLREAQRLSVCCRLLSAWCTGARVARVRLLRRSIRRRSALGGAPLRALAPCWVHARAREVCRWRPQGHADCAAPSRTRPRAARAASHIGSAVTLAARRAPCSPAPAVQPAPAACALKAPGALGTDDEKLLNWDGESFPDALDGAFGAPSPPDEEGPDDRQARRASPVPFRGPLHAGRPAHTVLLVSGPAATAATSGPRRGRRWCWRRARRLDSTGAASGARRSAWATCRRWRWSGRPRRRRRRTACTGARAGRLPWLLWLGRLRPGRGPCVCLGTALLPLSNLGTPSGSTCRTAWACCDLSGGHWAAYVSGGPWSVCGSHFLRQETSTLSVLLRAPQHSPAVPGSARAAAFEDSVRAMLPFVVPRAHPRGARRAGARRAAWAPRARRAWRRCRRARARRRCWAPQRWAPCRWRSCRPSCAGGTRTTVRPARRAQTRPGRLAGHPLLRLLRGLPAQTRHVGQHPQCSACLIVCWPGDLQRYITHGNWQIYCHVFSFDFSSEASKPLSCKPHTSRCASATLLMGARYGRRCAHGARRARSAGGPVAPAGHARRRGRHRRCSAASRRGRAGAVLLGRHAGRRSRPARCVRREQHHPSALPRA